MQQTVFERVIYTFHKVEKIRTPLSNDKRFLKVKQVRFELITCSSTCPIFILNKK